MLAHVTARPKVFEYVVTLDGDRNAPSDRGGLILAGAGEESNDRIVV